MDVVIENGAAQVVGLEVKAKASLQVGDLVGLRRLAAWAADRFLACFVLYDGLETLPLGPSLWAVPIATLWSDGPAVGGQPWPAREPGLPPG